jgi:hypothetical protein
MSYQIRCLTTIAVLAAMLFTAPVIADEVTGPPGATDEASRDAAIAAAIQADTEAAKAILKRSADFLAAQERFAFTARVSHDTLQPNGQKLQFGAVREVTVRRPDRLRIKSRTRAGKHHNVYFDGKKISIDIPEENAYVAVDKPGTLDSAIDYLVEDLGTPAPLHDFLTSNFYTDAADRIRSGYEIAMETIGERSCQHLAFRLAEVDVQFWIEEGDKPLPCGLVITYKREAASPQFRALFDDWDLSPKSSDRVFDYEPPDGAEQLPLHVALQENRKAVEGE